MLQALELARERSARWPELEEAIRLFVGANTDSPDVGVHAELVDSVSAFSRLAGAWDERGTVDGFIAALPPPTESDAENYGSRSGEDRLRQALANGRSVRAAWLSDAYRLRSQYGHGHVGTPPYRPTWSVHEHLLLSSVALPLTVKGVLAREGFYTLTDMDVVLNDSFDTLATLPQFGADESDEEESRHPWRDVMARISFRPLANQLAAALRAEAEAKNANEPDQIEPTGQQLEEP
jgi:hypothetical protein